MDVESVAAITKQLLEALRYLHQEGVIHRDIKPANIMVVNQDPVVQLWTLVWPLNL